mgnify:CR=1 FL=1
MEIYAKDKKIYVELDRTQPSYDALHEYIGEVPNLIGVIVHTEDDSGEFEQGIYQINDLGYAGKTQLGCPLVHTYLEDKEFRKLCEKLELDIWEYESCAKCKKPLWGTSTFNKEGKSVCTFSCED